jgi:hypothetical protein
MTRRLSIAALPRPPKTCGDQNGPAGFLEQRRSGGLLSGMFPEPQSFADAGPAVSDFPGGADHWLGSNGSTPIGLGAGVAGGSNWGNGLSNGFPNALVGGAFDPHRAGQSRTVTALMNHGLDADTARAAAGNPTILRAVLWQLHAPRGPSALSEADVGPAPRSQHTSPSAGWPDASDSPRPLSSKEPSLQRSCPLSRAADTASRVGQVLGRSNDACDRERRAAGQEFPPFAGAALAKLESTANRRSCQLGNTFA